MIKKHTTTIEIQDEVILYNKEGKLIGYIPSFGACNRRLVTERDIVTLYINDLSVAIWFKVAKVEIREFKMLDN